MFGDMRMAEMLRDASRLAVFLNQIPEVLATDVEQRLTCARASMLLQRSPFQLFASIQGNLSANCR
jgi:hypothetical protein